MWTCGLCTTGGRIVFNAAHVVGTGQTTIGCNGHGKAVQTWQHRRTYTTAQSDTQGATLSSKFREHIAWFISSFFCRRLPPLPIVVLRCPRRPRRLCPRPHRSPCIVLAACCHPYGCSSHGHESMSTRNMHWRLPLGALETLL